MAKIIGQSTALQIMSGIYKSGRLHHAYLFSGIDGIGKYESALNYAKVILCEKNNGTYCDECYHCVSIDSYKHPDVIIAGTDKRFVNAELYYSQFLKTKAEHLFKEFYLASRSILYKLESGLFSSYDNYPSGEPSEYMIGAKKDSSRDALIEPYYLAVNKTLSEINSSNADSLEDIFKLKSKEVLEYIKKRGSKKRVSIEGDFFTSLRKLYYNIVHTVIPLDTVRKIIEITYRKPSKGSRRIVIIEGLDLMDYKSPNIFLRTLEEPADGNIFILLTSNKKNLIKPLLSRVMDISFMPLSDKTLNSILTRRFRMSEDTAVLGVGHAGGSVSGAVNFLLDKKGNLGYSLDDILVGFIKAMKTNDASKIATIMTSICEGNYDALYVLRTLSTIFSEYMRAKYLDETRHSQYDVIPNSIDDVAIVWFLDELDNNIKLVLSTNTQQKLILRRFVTDTYVFFNKYFNRSYR